MILAALLLLAMAPEASAAPSPAPGLAPLSRQITLSIPGRKIAEKHFAEPDPEMTALGKQAQETRKQLAETIGQPVIDLARLETLMRQDEKLQAELRARSNTRMLGLLKALPEADRGAFLRGISTPVAPPPKP